MRYFIQISAWRVSTTVELFLAGCFFAFWIAAACAAEENRASEAKKQLGPPFYSGNILPMPQWQQRGSGSIALADGAAGRLSFNLRISDDMPAADLIRRLFQQRVDQFKEIFGGQWSEQSPGVEIRCELAKSEAELKTPDASAYRPQGYRLTITPTSIACIGRDNQGLVCAMASLVQLLHNEGGQLRAPCIDVLDFPVFQHRFVVDYAFPRNNSFYDWMALYKINGFATSWMVIDWRGLTKPLIGDMERIKQYQQKYQTIEYLAQIHLGGRGSQQRIDLGDPRNIQLLLKTIDETVEHSGTKHLMLLSDDLKDYGLTEPMEKQKYRSLGEGQAALLVCVQAELKKRHPEVQLSFCPPYYQGLKYRWWNKEKHPDLYAQAMEYVKHVSNWPADMFCVWTGPETASKRIVSSDIDGYQRLFGGRPLLYWDNTCAHHNPLSNFHAEYPPGFVDRCAGSIAFNHIKATKPLGRYFAATAMDYYWNPDAFKATRARRAAAAQLFGPDTLPAFERFYRLRGEDYDVRWSKRVDLKELKDVFRDLEAKSKDPGIAEQCWKAYESIVAERSGRK